jgi:hypothetical protein
MMRWTSPRRRQSSLRCILIDRLIGCGHELTLPGGGCMMLSPRQVVVSPSDIDTKEIAAYYCVWRAAYV